MFCSVNGNITKNITLAKPYRSNFNRLQEWGLASSSQDPTPATRYKCTLMVVKNFERKGLAEVIVSKMLKKGNKITRIVLKAVLVMKEKCVFKNCR